MRTIELWLHGVLLAAAVLVPLSLIGLAAWQVWGPRTPRADGKSHVAYPFAARGWLWGVATLAAAALVAPWFRLQLVPGAEVVVPISEAYELGPGATRGVTVARDPELREIAAMPAGYRFVHRGGQIGKAALASVLVAFAAVLVSLVARPGELWRSFFLGGCSAVGLLLIVGLLHESLDSPQWLVVDARTESGLSTFIAKFGSAAYRYGYPSTGPVLQALRPAYGALPAIGMMLALAACGAGLFLAVTELCWSPAAAPTPADVVPVAKSPPLDPAREAIRRRVAGPAIGLMIAGAIGLLPLLLALIVVPASIVLEPQVAPSRGYDQNSPPPPVHHDTDEAKTSFRERSAARAAIASVAANTAGLLPAQPALALPLLLAQAPDSIPRFFLLMPFLALFYLLNLAISITLIVAGWRMRQLKSHGLSLVAAILAMLPCTFGWIIGLPMGIWAFTILQRPEVREAFEG